MFGLLAGANPPPRIASDRVVPLRFFDDSLVWRSWILYSMFAFDDVLDVGRLHSSLVEVANSKGWEKLGARLRKNENGELEYHIPVEFTADRPAVFFSHEQHDQTIASHPLGSRIPRASYRPAIVGNPREFEAFMLRDGAPRNLDDYLFSDLPQLGLHVVSFTDKTVVTLSWPHTAFDIMGQSALLEAWTSKLNGQALKTPIGSESDLLVPFGTAPRESYKLEDRRMSIAGLMLYAARNAVDLVWRRHENRIELAAREDAESTPGNTWISEGDVLCAWWTRVMLPQLSIHPERTVLLNNAFSLRKPLENDLLPADCPYLSNAVGFINVLMSAKEILENPVSHLAGEIRRCINEQGTRPQVEAFAAMVRESANKLPPFFGDSGMHMITYSNWAKAKLYNVDFSSAVLSSESKRSDDSRVGRPSYTQSLQMGVTVPNGFPIMGKDLDGNYWLSGYMQEITWVKIEEELAKA
ncbi:transferase family protein [Sarocladium implicatum]|nr:transferase family protein [Sarocladium implicatum]